MTVLFQMLGVGKTSVAHSIACALNREVSPRSAYIGHCLQSSFLFFCTVLSFQCGRDDRRC